MNVLSKRRTVQLRLPRCCIPMIIPRVSTWSSSGSPDHRSYGLVTVEKELRLKQQYFGLLPAWRISWGVSRTWTNPSQTSLTGCLFHFLSKCSAHTTVVLVSIQLNNVRSLPYLSLLRDWHLVDARYSRAHAPPRWRRGTPLGSGLGYFH